MKNGRVFSDLGVTITHGPYDPFKWISAAPTMTTGGYEPPRGPEGPMAVFMMSRPYKDAAFDAAWRAVEEKG